MTDALSAIPERGKLTKNLIFIFSGTPKGLQYPSDQAGVQYRVLGKFMYDDEKAPGDIGVVPFPSIPTDREATFHINKYEFNAIFWALYKAGYLHLTLDKSNVPFQPAMNTSYYPDTPLPNIYPNRNLVIEVEVTVPPTVLLRENDKNGEADITYSADITYWVTKENSEMEKEKKIFVMAITDIDDLDNFAVSAKHSNGMQLFTFLCDDNQGTQFSPGFNHH